MKIIDEFLLLLPFRVLIHCMSLALAPSGHIGLEDNKKLWYQALMAYTLILAT
jgi:hypothetical protein